MESSKIGKHSYKRTYTCPNCKEEFSPPKHGNTGYTLGCRCLVCRNARNANAKKRRFKGGGG